MNPYLGGSSQKIDFFFFFFHNILSYKMKKRSFLLKDAYFLDFIQNVKTYFFTFRCLFLNCWVDFWMIKIRCWAAYSEPVVATDKRLVGSNQFVGMVGSLKDFATNLPFADYFAAWEPKFSLLCMILLLWALLHLRGRISSCYGLYCI